MFDQSQVSASTIQKLDGSVQTVGSQTPTVTRLDGFSYILESFGTVLPTATTAGYSKNSTFVKTDASGGTSGLYTNIGTTASCNFQAVDVAAGAPFTLPNGDFFIGDVSNVAVAHALSGDITSTNTGVVTIANNAVTTAKILNANVTLAKLAAGITPSHVIKFAGKSSNGGGSATIAITVTGALATDVVFAQLEASTNAVTVEKVTPTSNTVTVLLSGDPGAGTIVSYQVLRAAA